MSTGGLWELRISRPDKKAFGWNCSIKSLPSAERLGSLEETGTCNPSKSGCTQSRHAQPASSLGRETGTILVFLTPGNPWSWICSSSVCASEIR
eukprot:2421188-Heterocapsa_arctica.AAC.1